MIKLIGVLVTVVILLTGCSDSLVIETNDFNTVTQDSTQVDDFTLNIATQRNTYRTGEPIIIWAEFGNHSENDITIYHGLPYLTFKIIGDNGFEMIPMTFTVLESSILTAGEINTYGFVKNGSWGTYDADAPFWENFFAEPDLYLPPGNYTITATADFSLSAGDVIGSRVTLTAEIAIVVTD